VGNFVVVWESDEPLAPDPSGGGIFGRQFNANGAPLGAEFLVNSYTTGGQHIPAVAATGAGSFVAAWFSAYGDGSDPFLSNQAQRLMAPLATTDLLPGRLAVIKPGGLARIVAKPVSGDTFALPAADPMTTGGNIRLFDTASAAGDVSHALPTTGWRATRPPGPNGYYYRGAGTESDPCRLVLVTRNGIRAVCRLALTPPFAGDVGVILTVGTDRYCARFGGDDLRNNATITRRRRAPAPGACP